MFYCSTKTWVFPKTNVPVAQLLERSPAKAEVVSEILTGDTTARSSTEEHLAYTQDVAGAAPAAPTICLTQAHSPVS